MTRAVNKQAEPRTARERLADLRRQGLEDQVIRRREGRELREERLGARPSRAELAEIRIARRTAGRNNRLPKGLKRDVRDLSGLSGREASIKLRNLLREEALRKLTVDLGKPPRPEAI